ESNWMLEYDRAPLHRSSRAAPRGNRCCMCGVASFERHFWEEQGDEQGDRGDGRCDVEDVLDAVDDIDPCRVADMGELLSRTAHRGGEYRAENSRADGTAERAEKRGGCGRDAELLSVDAVLHCDDENLRDHAEAEAEHAEADTGGDA